MKYLIVFLLTMSCFSQQHKTIPNNNGEFVFITKDWKKLVLNEFEHRLDSGNNSKREQLKISEDIAFINSKDNYFLERQFLILGFKNRRLNTKGDFYFINIFSNREDHDEYSYILENSSTCHSYLYRNDGFGHLTIKTNKNSKKGKKCEQKINAVNDLKKYSRQDQFFRRDALLILWSFVNGKREISVIPYITSSQDDLIENIFYDAHYPIQNYMNN